MNESVNESDTVQMDLKGLDAIIKSLKTVPTIRVGILGGSSTRSGKGKETNATIGARHEFGTSTLPIRSFLRMPITEKFQSFLEKSNLFDENAFKRVVKEGSILQWAKALAITAEACILEAFATGGFGKWKPSNFARKKNAETLVETKQLRDSITSEVKE